MESASVRERLLRLNQEIHDERFEERDLSYVIDLWERARESYKQSNFGMAENLIDEAYRVLYAGHDVQPSPTQQPQMQQPTEMQAEVTPVYVVYEGEGDIISKITSQFLDFIYLSAKTVIRPTEVFSNLATIRPVSETLAFFVFFGVLLAVIFLGIINPALELNFDLIHIFIGIVGVGFFFCIFISALTYLVMKSFKGKGSFALTAAVYGFSLMPLIVCVIILLYLDYSTTIFVFEGNALTTGVAGVLVLVAIIVAGIVWNIFLQSIGLSLIHQVSRKKSALAAFLVSIVFAVLLFMMATGGVFMRYLGS